MLKNKKQQLLIILILFELAGCSQSEPESKVQPEKLDTPYITSEFSFRPPKGWRQHRKPSDAKVVFADISHYVASANDKFVPEGAPALGGEWLKAGISVLSQKSNLPFSEFIKASKDALKSEIADFKIIEEESLDIDGKKTLRILYTGTLNAYKYKWLQFIIDYGLIKWIITGSTLASNYNQYSDLFLTSAKTFKFFPSDKSKSLDFVPISAITTGGSLKIDGNVKILGKLGNVHTNMNTLINGDPVILQKLTAVGSVTITGKPRVSGGIKPFSESVSIPEIDPTQYKNLAKYVLSKKGEVIDISKRQVIASSSSGSWKGFKYSSGEWQVNGNDITESATYFVESQLTISGNPIVDTTFLVNHNVKIIGDSTMKPIGFMQIITKGDILISGNTT